MNSPTANQGNYGWAGLGYTAQSVGTFLEFGYENVKLTSAGGSVIPVLLSAVNAGTGITYSVVVKEVDGALTSTLPTGSALSASTGVLTVAGTTAAGTCTIGLAATASNGVTAETEVTVVVA